jgi:hypothetical protein
VRRPDDSRAALQKHLMGAGELMRSNALEAAPRFTDVADPQQVLFEDPVNMLTPAVAE